MNPTRLRASLVAHEGRRAKPYMDTTGNLTAGVGRNVKAVLFSDDEIELMLDNDIRRAWNAARELVPSFAVLSDERQEVLVEMAFNLGPVRLGAFRDFLAAIEAGDFQAAAREMLDSAWATQVGVRAQTLAQRMRRG